MMAPQRGTVLTNQVTLVTVCRSLTDMSTPRSATATPRRSRDAAGPTFLTPAPKDNEMHITRRLVRVG
jgi:hypothetical protein